MKHFLKETDFDTDEIRSIFSRAFEYKQNRGRPLSPAPLSGQTWGLLFYKNSTRTRVSFEVGLNELGAHPLILDQRGSQIGRGESIADTARVLSRYLNGIIIRTYGQEIIEEFAKWGDAPVVNALTDFLHPCQIYADCFTLCEKLGQSQDPFSALEGKKLVFLGDTACNMANSWLLAGALFGMNVALAGPASYAPGQPIKDLLEAEGLPANHFFTTDPAEAVAEADVVYTDVWVSMGDEDEEASRLSDMRPYSVTKELLDRAKPDALFMHCMPAHPGQEVSQEVLDDTRSILFDQAENRLHVQKAILAQLAQANG